MNIFRKKRKVRKGIKELSLGRVAARVLRIGIPLIFIYLCAFLIMISRLSEDIPTYIIARVYSDTLEHIAMSALLIIAGALLLDILEKNFSKNS